MKFFMLLGALALVVGIFFHAEVGQFISGMAGGSGVGSGVGSAVQSTGSAGKSLFNSVGNSF